MRSAMKSHTGLRGLTMAFAIGMIALVAAPSFADKIDCGNYRIALSFDGNDYDPDDILAAPMALALIAEAGVKDKFVFMDYSNNIWGDKGSQPKEMRASVSGACSRWGFDESKCFEARVPTELNKAKTAFRNAAIEAYNAGATLYYACGGPMEVPYQMVSNLEKKYRSVVTVVSHHWWNDYFGTRDKHYREGARDWDDLKAIAGNSIHIDDQNADVWSTSISSWSWLKNKGGKYEWLFNRNPFSGKFDGSDAGMTYFIFTGRGNDDATMSDAKWIFNQSHSCGGSGGTTNNPPSVSITSPSNGASFTAPADVSVSANAADSDGSISKVELRSNGSLVGTENASPYNWSLTGLSAGTYTLQARAYDNDGATKNASISITVTDDGGSGGGGGGTSGSLILEAENYNSQSGITTESCTEGGKNVTDINDGDHIMFRSVDFGTGASKFYLRTASPRDKGTIELRLGSVNGTLIGSKPVPSTGDWQAWTTLSGNVSGASGVKDLYVVFTGTNNKYLFNLNWVSFDVDGGGGSTTNNPPSVGITSPSNGATFTAPADVSVSADASDSDGSIAKVELRNNGSLVGTQNSGPYTFSLTGLSAGTYTLQARAYDNDGATTNSSISITVTDDGGSGGGGTVTSVAINAAGSSFSGSDGVSYVADQYYSGGKTYTSSDGISGTTDDALYRSERYASSFSYAIPVENGDYAVTLKFAEVYFSATGKRVFDVAIEGSQVISNLDIYAKVGKNAAYDETHAVNVSDGTLNIDFSADVNNAKIAAIVVGSSGSGGTTPSNSAPSVSITSPSNGASYTAPADVTVEASASDADGSISKVELRSNGSLVGTQNSSPYTFSLTGLSAGTYTLQARAYDNDGATTNASISISVTDASGGTSDPQTLTFNPVDDAYIEGSKTVNNSVLKVEPDYRVSYLKFDIQGLGSSVNSATLTLRVDGDPGDGTIRVYEGSHSNWTESNLSTSNDPSAGSAIDSRSGSWNEGQDYSFDLTSLISGNGTYTLVIKMDAGGNDAWFSSSEGSANPELVVTTTGLSKRSPAMALPARSAIDLAMVNIFDMSGRLVYSGTTRDVRNITTKSVGFNERGVFLMRINSKFGLKNRKIVIK